MSFTFTFFTKPPIHYSLYNNNNNDNTHSSNPFNTNPNFNPFFHYKPSTRSLNRVDSLPQKYPFHNPLERTHHYIALFSFSSILLCLRLLFNVLLPNFPHRWRELVAFSQEAEARTTAYPSHLWRAVVAYEDVRFFTHFGVDPVGVSRAVLSLSARGGGSTITQQFVSVHERYYFILNLIIGVASGSFPSSASGFLFYGLVVVDGASFSEFVYPNFTASNLKFINKTGAFLFSRNGTFKAAIFNPGAEQTRFYFCVIHMASNFIIWSANRDTPISSSGELALTRDGMAISDENGDTKWSTSQLGSPVYALQLTEIGNLVLLDQFNGSLWESFDLPTDTIVIGQQLPVGVLLSSAKSDDDLSTGNYTFQVTTSDAILQWQEQTYWMLSMDTMAYVNSIYIVDYMVINGTGIYLLSHNGSDVVIQVMLQSYNFRIANLAPSGHFRARSFNGKEWKTDFFGPIDDCRIPSICGSIGLCTNNNPLCACPLGFHVATKTSGCVPDGSYSLPGACNRTSNENNINSSLVSYLSLGYDIDYFAIGFFNPARFGVNLSSCQDLCSRDCSCLGIFYENSSGSCYPVENELGSIMSSDGGVNDLLGFIKAVGHTTTNGKKSSNEESGDFPVGAIVALLCASIFLSVAVGFVFWRKMIRNKVREGKLDHNNSRSSDELDAFYIQGLPQSQSTDDNHSSHSSLSSGHGLLYFPLFALEMHEQRSYLELADSRLEGRVTSEEVEKLVQVALCCVHEEPSLRPSMSTVVSMLEGVTPIDEPKIESLNFLRFYGRRFTEASMIEEENGQNDEVVYPNANGSPTSSTNGSHSVFLSFMSSQQLVKNTFLRCERTFSRKIAEMVLALALERVMSKRRILGCYMSKIYWGHGVYGIESASNFYFGKHPSLLNLGEAALLAGIIPAPEIRSPFMDSSRGKVFQARVLKRMVKVGFIDTETALVALKQSLHLCAHGPDDEDGLLRALSLSKKELAESRETKCSNAKSSLKDRWDWEKECKVWEVCEDMERWATTVTHTPTGEAFGEGIIGTVIMIFSQFYKQLSTELLMDNIVDSLNNAYQEFMVASANLLEVKDQSDGQKSAASDGALENFKQKLELFRVACDQAEEFVESVKQRIGSECLVDEATGLASGKQPPVTAGLPPISAVRLEQMSKAVRWLVIELQQGSGNSAGSSQPHSAPFDARFNEDATQ
ncbi:hypothetical protein ACFE04_025810 [Oxalis oulophora]